MSKESIIKNSLPSTGNIHINQPLTNLSLAIIQDANWAAANIPVVGVDYRDFRYYNFPKEFWLRINARERAPGSRFPVGGYDLTTEPGEVKIFDIAHRVAYENRNNADTSLDLEVQGARWVAEQLRLARESEFLSTAMATSVWTGSSTGADIVPTVKWNAANSTPVQDVRTQKVAFESKNGKQVTHAFITLDVVAALMDNPAIFDRMSDFNPQFPDLSTLSAAFGIPNIVVVRAINDTSAEGATSAPDFFEREKMLLLHLPDQGGLMTASAMYNFTWTRHFDTTYRQGTNNAQLTGQEQLLGASLGIMRVEDRLAHAIEIQGVLNTGYKVTAPSLGVLFNDCLA